MFDLRAVGATFLPFVGSIPSSIITKNNIKSWYEKLKKPSWRPPNWMFGPVWTALYASMGYASYLVYRDGGGFLGAAGKPLLLYAGQLVLNWAWTPLFFGKHDVKWGFRVICLLWVNVLVCGLSFYEVNQTAGYLMVPYQAWLTLAALLNLEIWRLNGDRPDFSHSE